MVIYPEDEGFSPAILTGNQGAFWLSSGRVSLRRRGRWLVSVGGSAAKSGSSSAARRKYAALYWVTWCI